MSVIITTGMDMPKCWDDCEYNSNCECCLIDATCHDETSIDGESLPDFCPLKSVEGLIEKIEQAKQYKGLTGNPTIDKHNIGLDRYFDLGLDKAMEIIKEYCEVEE